MVHIKKVEIFGFKSFGFKNTIVDFEPGLISISGPNGSGKSNILDAIIFALGENRPKVMRAPNLRALIHDIEGSTRRGPKMARSSVQFDNTDRKIPVDSDLVTITREMNDKGDNIYFLDKTKVQRQKILELMELANAGLNQMNAVQQGTVTRISEFTSEEKRETIEDLIGLSAFDEKKKESEKQLFDADQKLAISLAKMGEVKKRIDDLEIERNHKLRYDVIEKELNRFRAISAASNLKVLLSEKTSKERTQNALNSEKKHFEDERTIVRKQHSELQAQKNQFLDETNAYNQSKSKIDTALSGVKQSFDAAESSIITSNKRLTQINSRIPELVPLLTTIEEERSSLELQINDKKEVINSLRQTKKEIDDVSESVTSRRAEILKKQSNISSQKHEVDKKISNLTNKITHAKLLIGKIDSEITDIDEKLSTNYDKQENISINQDYLHKQKIKLERVIGNHKQTIEQIKQRIKIHDEKKIKLENETTELLSLIDASSKGANKYETKIKFVKGIMHEDYSISKLKHDADNLGIEGLVYDILSWNKKYERAVLAVSSDWIKAVVVKNFEALISIAQYVRNKKLPKIKIIPLEEIPDIKLSRPNNPAIIGILSDYVSCNSEFNPLKTFLFGNILLVDSRDSAIKISKLGYKTITLEGEFYDAKTSAVVIDINSKISKLTKIINMSDSVEGLQSMISVLRKTTQKKKNLIKKYHDSIKINENRINLSEQGLIVTHNSYSDLKHKINSTAKILEQFLSRKNQLEKKKISLSTELIKQQSHLESLESQISLVRENYAEPQMDNIANELISLNEQFSISMKSQNTNHTELKEKETNLATLMASITKNKSEHRTLQQEYSTIKDEKYHLEVDVRKQEKEKTIAEDELIRLRQEEQDLISTSGNSVQKMKEFDDSIDKLHNQERDLTREIGNRDRQSDSLNRDLSDIRDKESKIKSMLATFGFDESLEVFDVTSLISSLENEQNKLRPSLNAGAPSQFSEIAYGYRTSSSKKNLLEQERNKIVSFIESVEKEKRQTFLNAFDTVDKEIRDAFSKMTGGNAWLELENEDDIFSSGLNYIIQFPNKPKRESTSISGGEKTLAAIVFVLALQKLNPSPFYLFDEVDAHLDAPNASKLSKIIKERSIGSQFLMVSLKDSVVEKARLIYGVFPKNGVSNVVKYKDKRMLNLEEESTITT
ncbi:chromosome segregation protein SMC [Candidatus Nitrosopelagicus sp.]|nr:chromosome segregation protein SMC [Candidatus Nitrosopelagicus sp.]